MEIAEPQKGKNNYARHENEERHKAREKNTYGDGRVGDWSRHLEDDCSKISVLPPLEDTMDPSR